MREVAVRWLVHHSQMRPDDLGIVYGASKLSQLEEALTNQLRTFFFSRPLFFSVRCNDLQINFFSCSPQCQGTTSRRYCRRCGQCVARAQALSTTL
jgi:hypothetical protein